MMNPLAGKPLPYTQVGEIVCPVTGEVISRLLAAAVGEFYLPSFFLSHFTEDRILGSGGYATVVRCKNKFDGKEYAVKKISVGENFETDPDSGEEDIPIGGLIEYEPKPGSGPVNDSTSFKALLREASIWSMFNHSNIVRYFECWPESKYCGLHDDNMNIQLNKPCLYVQLELCQSSLAEKLNTDKMNNWTTKEESTQIFEEILHGLVHIHEQNIMHGDISKDNILFSNDEAKISDFGLARPVGAENDEINTQGDNCRPYRAPERKTAPADVKADIYSLGILLFEMLQPFGSPGSRSRALEDLRMRKAFPEWWTDTPVKKRVLEMIDDTPSNRPSAAYLQERKKSIRAEISGFEAIPIE